MALSTHLSNHKLYLFGTLCVILVQGMTCIELGANTHLQFPGLSEQGYLQVWGDEMPRLASDGFVLSWSSRVPPILLDYLPTLLPTFGLMLIGLFFRRLAKDERWLQRNIRTLIHISLLSFLAFSLQPFINTLQGLVPSLNPPNGKRVLNAPIGLTSETTYEFLKVTFLRSLGPVMSEARKLDEEVRAFI